MREPKIVLWDLETFGFDFHADKGFILCGSYKAVGERKIHTVARENLGRDMWDDKSICKKLARVLTTADMWVTHNGKRFDVRFLNTRLLKHGLAPLPPVPHFDTCEVIWKTLKMRARLESTQKFFGWKEAKTPLNLETWTRAAGGSRVALKEVIAHCEADVRVLEKAYEKLRPMAFKHPSVSAIAEDPKRCVLCGKRNTLQRRGYTYAKVRKSARYQCTSCGGWSHGPAQKIEGVEIR